MHRYFVIVLLVGTAVVGCDFGPAAIDAPGWNPDKQSSKAIELFDKNQDGVIDEGELSEAPGLASAVWHLDKDGDKGVSKDELNERLQLYEDMQTGLVSIQIQVTQGGRPLPDAEVVLTPEEYVSDVLEQASGTTDSDGMVSPVSKSAPVPGIKPGFYRIEVKSPRIKNDKSQQAKSYGVEASPTSDGTQSSDITQIRL